MSDGFYRKLDEAAIKARNERIFANRPENLHDYQGCANDPAHLRERIAALEAENAELKSSLPGTCRLYVPKATYNAMRDDRDALYAQVARLTAPVSDEEKTLITKSFNEERKLVWEQSCARGTIEESTYAAARALIAARSAEPKKVRCGSKIYVGTTGESACELFCGHKGNHRQGSFEWSSAEPDHIAASGKMVAKDGKDAEPDSTKEQG